MIRKFHAVAAAVAALAAAAAPSASAEFGVTPGTLDMTLSTTQAGGHPDLTTTFSLNTRTNPDANVTEVDGNLKDVLVDLPAGITGAATATPRCDARELFGAGCPASTQVGVTTIYNNVFGNPFPGTVGVYNMVPSHGHTAELGFRIMIATQTLVVRVRPDDGGLQTSIPDVSEAIQVQGTTLTLWGVPGAPEHTPQRGQHYTCFGDPTDPNNCFGGGEPSTAPVKPFLTNPTSCGQPLEAELRMSSWQNPGTVLDYHDPLGTITGCDKLHFDPTITVRPTTRQVDSPMGLAVKVEVPQNDDPNGLASANLRRAVVKLPAGITLSPAAADGLVACTDAQLGLGDANDPSCPAASTLGTAVLHTPALPDPLTGPIYLRPQTPDDTFRIVMVLQGDGVTLKIPGSVHPDPVTGQLTTTFDDAPQQPFSDLELTFNGGPKAPLTTPMSCGTVTSTAAFTPWSSDAAVDASDRFDVAWDDAGAACPAALPFSPGFSAGVTNPVAGASSPFLFRVTRDDRNQLLGSIDGVHLPPGLVADVKSVGRCANGPADAGTCDASSQVGEALVSAGAGSQPLQLRGKVYLTEGYKGAPFGLAIVVPAIAGPFDLGTVVVRAAVNVGADASLSVDADRLPTIVSGIPLRLRDIQLGFNRPGFMLNPTNCDPMSVAATVRSVDGAAVPVNDRFQLADCARLGFAPKFAVTSKAASKEAQGAALHVHIAGRSGDANLRSVALTLPSGIGPRFAALSGACSEDLFAAGKCPAAATVGTARAVTRILPEPLTGQVQLVSRKGKLPQLAMTLRGDGIAIPLVGDVLLKGTRVTTRFSAIPDVPITQFDMDLPGGSKSLLIPGKDLCGSALKAPTTITGQNGMLRSGSTTVAVQGCRLRIAKVAVSGRSARLTVTGLTTGTLRVSGRGVVSVRKTIGSSSIAHVTVRLGKTSRGGKRCRLTAQLRPSGSGRFAYARRTVKFGS